MKKIKAMQISGLKLINTKKTGDNRGSFHRLFCVNDFKNILGKNKVVQINMSSNKKKGAIRGMHYQVGRYAECKFIQCIKGRILDVAIDLRKSSKTFLKYQTVELSEKDNKIFYIPKNFAHGFQTLEKNSQLIYFHTMYYNDKYERRINPLDKEINIKWPLKITSISLKDKKALPINKRLLGT